MREKLQTLPLSELKEMAKSRGIKGISSLRKAEIIDLLCDEAEKNPDIKPAEIKREVKTETSRSQETPRSHQQAAGEYSAGICIFRQIQCGKILSDQCADEPEGICQDFLNAGEDTDHKFLQYQ